MVITYVTLQRVLASVPSATTDRSYSIIAYNNDAAFDILNRELVQPHLALVHHCRLHVSMSPLVVDYSYVPSRQYRGSFKSAALGVLSKQPVPTLLTSDVRRVFVTY